MPSLPGGAGAGVTSESSTRWWPVCAAFIAGCLAAAQIGKVAGALSVVIADLGLSLLQGGLVVSLFTLTTALTGAAFGLLGDRFGHLPLALAGLLVSAAGAVAGAFAESIGPLLIARLLEGTGFTLAVVCLPPLISQAASERDRPMAMGLWAAFMPGGMALAMLASPWLIAASGWRGLWLATGALLAGWSVLLWLTFRRRATSSRESRRRAGRTASIRWREPLRLFGCFACYSAMYVPLTAFFTTLLVSQKQVPLDIAAWVGAPVVAVNIVGNLAAGWLVRRGVAADRLQRLAFVVMGVSGCIVFAAASPVVLKVCAGLVFSAFGGLIPGTLFILAPGLASHPAQIAALSGLLLQGAGVGQTLGPMLVSASVDRFGAWGYGGATLVFAAVLGTWLASGIGGRGRVRD